MHHAFDPAVQTDGLSEERKLRGQRGIFFPKSTAQMCSVKESQGITTVFVVRTVMLYLPFFLGLDPLAWG